MIFVHVIKQSEGVAYKDAILKKKKKKKPHTLSLRQPP